MNGTTTDSLKNQEINQSVIKKIVCVEHRQFECDLLLNSRDTATDDEVFFTS